jgi:hypothetical protein
MIHRETGADKTLIEWQTNPFEEYGRSHLLGDSARPFESRSLSSTIGRLHVYRYAASWCHF